MYFHRIYFLLIALVISVALIIGGINLIYNEFNVGYRMNFQSTFTLVGKERNLLKAWAVCQYEKLFRTLFNTNESGLPPVHIYVPEKVQKSLIQDIPVSLKQWRKAYIKDDGRFNRIKVRTRGDNTTHWGYEKKSWRVKRKKQQVVNRVRKLDYIVPRTKNIFDWHLGCRIAHMAGVLAPDTRLVELFINDMSYGVYNESEFLGESFLRNNNIMPVNFYKGEQENAERKLMVDMYLFNNPALWKKLSYFNLLPENDYSDMEYFINLVKCSETSERCFEKLKMVCRIEDWARFSAFQTLIQYSHSSDHHNGRLILDPWKGSVIPVVTDPSVVYSEDEELKLDLPGNSFLGLYHMSSEFILEKYKILNSLLMNDILTNAASEQKTILPSLRKTWARDKYHNQFVYSNMLDRGLAYDNGMEVEWKRFFKRMEFLDEWLRNELSKNPSVSWYKKSKNIVSVVIDSAVPVDKLTFFMQPTEPMPTSVFWDVDGNGVVTVDDIEIPYTFDDNRIILMATWGANHRNGKHYPTQFNIIYGERCAIEALTVNNAITGEEFNALRDSGKKGMSPHRLNRPIIESGTKVLKELPKSMTIEKTMVFSDPVRIHPGTTIKMKPQTSLIFREKLFAEGTEDCPIVITASQPGNPWGVIALHGKSTSNSKLSCLSIDSGSESFVDNVRYSAMLSLHETSNVKLINIKMKNSYKSDDMLHIIYSQDIDIINPLLENALGDAIDIDMSSFVTINGGKIYSSGNDGVDLMSSSALIRNVQILSSGDKGVSVGEASDALIFKSSLNGNVTGIASKDDSMVTVIDSMLNNNKKQVEAYYKNWRYGKGGRVLIDSSVLSAESNDIFADERSMVNILNSEINPQIYKPKETVKIEYLLERSVKEKGDSSLRIYKESSKDLLHKWGISENK